MKKKQHKNRGIPAALACGLAVGILVTVLSIGLIAFLISGEHLQESMTGYASILTLVLASAVGAWVSSKLAGERILLIAAVSSIVYFIALLCCTAMFFGGQYQGIWQTLLAVLGAGLSVGLLRIGGSVKGKRRRKNYGFR